MMPASPIGRRARRAARVLNRPAPPPRPAVSYPTVPWTPEIERQRWLDRLRSSRTRMLAGMRQPDLFEAAHRVRAELAMLRACHAALALPEPAGELEGWSALTQATRDGLTGELRRLLGPGA